MLTFFYTISCNSFGATDNYLVFLEQPLRIDVLKILRSKVLSRPVDALSFFSLDEQEKV